MGTRQNWESGTRQLHRVSVSVAPSTEPFGEQGLGVCTSSSCLSGDDSSTCIGILAKEVEIVASSDSSISSKARGSNKVSTRTLWHI
jgi:hypothetical protein